MLHHPNGHWWSTLSQSKVPFIRNRTLPSLKTTPSCENTLSSAVAAKWGNQMPQDWSFEILQIFYALFSHVWIPRIPAKRQERGKKHPKSFSSHNHSLSCMRSCRLTACLVKWGMWLYLKGFKEASSSSSGPVLQLIFVSTQTHHGLAVYVQLLIQSLQQSWTRTLLTSTTRSVCTGTDAHFEM